MHFSQDYGAELSLEICIKDENLDDYFWKYFFWKKSYIECLSQIRSSSTLHPRPPKLSAKNGT